MPDATLAVEGKHLLLLDDAGNELSRVLGGKDEYGFYRLGEPLNIPDDVDITNDEGKR